MELGAGPAVIAITVGFELTRVIAFGAIVLYVFAEAGVGLREDPFKLEEIVRRLRLAENGVQPETAPAYGKGA